MPHALLVDLHALRQRIVLLQDIDGLINLASQRLRRLQQQQELTVVHLQEHTCRLAAC